MSECADLTYYQRNWDVILNRPKDYYENDKERLRVQAGDKYRNLSEQEKNKRRKYGKKQILQYVWRKKTKTKRIWKKIIARLKGINIIMNKIVYAVIFSYTNCNKLNSFLVMILIM